MSNIPFEGMTKVPSDEAERASLAVILFVERSRNNLFQAAVNEEIKNPWHFLPLFVDVDKLPKSVLYNPMKWFTRIPLPKTLEEVMAGVRGDWTLPYFAFAEKELRCAMTMIELVHDNDILHHSASR